MSSDLAKQWHPTKNLPLTSRDITIWSNKKVWWKCDRGHEWQTTVSGRNAGRGCPYCSGKYVCNDNCLATLNPDIAKQWHPTRNLPLTSRDITIWSNKKVWWKCGKGHEWQTTINGRSAGYGCPYCSGKYVCNDNCLTTLNPELARQWHPTRNGSLTPRYVTAGSNKKVWWICTKSHEWQAVVSSRSTGVSCPHCSGKAVCDDNCLATLNPDLAKQWHPTKNGSLTARDVTLHSGKKVWWKCKKGHVWQSTMASRSAGIGCPKCYPQISQLELRVYCELKSLFPSTTSKEKIFGKECDIYISEIKAGIEVDGLYWHRDKYLKDKKKSDAIRSRDITLLRVREAGLRRTSAADIFYTPKDGALIVIKKIIKALKEQCSLNQDQDKDIERYLQRHTFANDSEYKKLWDLLPSPFPGFSLSEQRPELVKEWHKEKNGTLSPEDVSLFTHTKVWWKCDRGHEWQTAIAHRSAGKGCPYCSGKYVCNDNCLATLNPNLAKQWHPIRNLLLTSMDVTPQSNIKVWWKCDKGHEWQAAVSDRSTGRGCPYCAGKATCNDNCLATLNPDLAKQWHLTKNGRLTPRDVTLHSGKKVWWKCDKDHEWLAAVYSRSTGTGCPCCSGRTACNDNCLAGLNPDLAKQWHPTKNGSLTPRDVTKGSHTKAWWVCDKGHEWQAVVKSRVAGRGCPYCGGKAVCDDNCLATMNPDLAK